MGVVAAFFIGAVSGGFLAALGVVLVVSSDNRVSNESHNWRAKNVRRKKGQF